MWLDSSVSYRCNLEQVFPPGLQVAWVSYPVQYTRRWWLSRFLMREKRRRKKKKVHLDSYLRGRPMTFKWIHKSFGFVVKRFIFDTFWHNHHGFLAFLLSMQILNLLMVGWSRGLVWVLGCFASVSSINLHTVIQIYDSSYGLSPTLPPFYAPLATKSWACL